MFVPGRCVCCGRPGASDGLCRVCLARFQGVSLPDPRLGTCPVCGQQRLAEAGMCTDCSAHPWSFPRIEGPGAYNDDASEPVRLYKLAGQRVLVEPWGARLAPRVHPPWPLVPVPPLASHVWKRGWDPVETLVRVVARQTRTPVWRPLVRRRSRAQKTLDAPGRWTNAHRAYGLRPGWGPRLRSAEGVWLVDDVVTTGATVEACARLLRDAGVGEVRVLCLAAH